MIDNSIFLYNAAAEPLVNLFCFLDGRFITDMLSAIHLNDS